MKATLVRDYSFARQSESLTRLVNGGLRMPVMRDGWRHIGGIPCVERRLWEDRAEDGLRGFGLPKDHRRRELFGRAVEHYAYLPVPSEVLVLHAPPL